MSALLYWASQYYQGQITTMRTSGKSKMLTGG